MNANFNKLYKTVGGRSFLTGSANVLYKEYKEKKLKPPINLRNAEIFLSKQVVYTVHRNAREHFPRNRVHVKFIGDVVSADLADLKTFKENNDGNAYILCVIDCFSKQAYALPLKEKTAEETLKQFKKIHKIMNYKIHNLSVDNGGEFRKSFETFCKKTRINLYQVQGTMKNSIVERFIQTLKSRLFRFIRWKGTHRWVDILPSIIESYNKTPHRSIGMAPNDVSVENSHHVYKKLFPERWKRIPQKYHVGDIVRFSKTYKKGIEKPYEGKWSLSVYRINNVKYMPMGPYPMYHLEEAYSKKDFGDYWWYGKQLQKIDKKTFASKDTSYELQVLKKRGKKSLIQWLDYPDEKPTWVLTSAIHDKKQ
jgi:hypothetical protein